MSDAFQDRLSSLGARALEPAPRRKHTERQVGETYADALSRVAGERDAALRDVARLADQVAAVTRLADDLDREAAGTDQWRRLDRDDEAMAMAGPMKARQLREDAKRIRAAFDAPLDVT